MSTGPTRNAWLDTVGKDRPPSASPKAGIFVYIYVCLYIYIHVQWARFTFKYSKQVQTWTLNSISRSKHPHIFSIKKKRSYWGYWPQPWRPRLAEAPSQIAMSSGALLVCSFWCHCSMNLHSMPAAVELAGLMDQKRVMTIFSKSMEINDQWIDVKFW